MIVICQHQNTTYSLKRIHISQSRSTSIEVFDKHIIHSFGKEKQIYEKIPSQQQQQRQRQN